jgi:hypothetical protein
LLVATIRSLIVLSALPDLPLCVLFQLLELLYPSGELQVGSADEKTQPGGWVAVEWVSSADDYAGAAAGGGLLDAGATQRSGNRSASAASLSGPADRRVSTSRR